MMKITAILLLVLVASSAAKVVKNKAKTKDGVSNLVKLPEEDKVSDLTKLPEGEDNPTGYTDHGEQPEGVQPRHLGKIGKRVKSIVNTPACLSAGGICLATGDCPAEKLSAKPGLCSPGAECCHGLPNREQDCAKRGGNCQTSCPTNLTDKLGKCSAGNVCCILV